MESGNLFAPLPAERERESVEALLSRPGVRLERIVSFGQATPAGQWYDQPHDEWVILLAGRAELSIEGERERRVLAPGDFLLLPAHLRHRVAATAGGEATVWLALHLG